MPILSPKTSLSIIRAQTTQGLSEQRVLLIGQMLSGTATAGALTSDVPNSEASIGALFGAKSHIASLCKKFKAVNSVTPLDVIALDDAGGATSASATFVFTGTATEDGTLVLSVMDKPNIQASVAITSGDAATAIATAAAAALNALAADQPFSASPSTGTVTVTAANGGTLFNGAPISVEGSVAGVSVAITAFASGATDPTFTSVFDVVGNQRYQTIGWPSTWASATLKTFLDARFNDAYRAMDGVGIYSETNTYANLNGGPSENSQSIVVIGDNLLDLATRKGPAIQSLADHKTAVFCAIRSLRLTDDAPLTSVQTTAAPSDQFGGLGISSLPYHNTLMPELTAPLPEDEFSLDQIDDLTGDGYTIAAANRVYTGVILGDAVTTYLTTVSGDPDTSFKYLNTVDNSSAIREYYLNNLRSQYAQTRLTNGDLVAGRDMANTGAIRSFCKAKYQELASEAILEAGSTALADYDENLIVVVDVGAGRATIDQAPLQVGGLRLIIGTIAVKFSS